MALGIKTFTLLIREVRLWLVLSKPRSSFQQTLCVGFASGLLHTFLPGRGGDLAALLMLKKYCKRSAAESAYAVGICSFFEIFVFGVLLLFYLLIDQSLWRDTLGDQLMNQSINSTLLILFGSLIFVVIAMMIGRRVIPRAEEEEQSFSIIAFLKDCFQHTHKGLSSKNTLLIQLFASLLEVYLMLYSFALGLQALGIETALPLSMSALVLAFASLAAILLPPSYGAGPAAAIAFVFALFHLSETEALAYSSIWWIISQVPPTITGIPAFWLLKKPKTE